MSTKPAKRRPVQRLSPKLKADVLELARVAGRAAALDALGERSEERWAGRVSEAVDTFVASLRHEGELDTHAEVLIASARELALTLDQGDSKSLASVARELRATLAELAKDRGDDGDDDDWQAGLSSPVRDTPEP